MAKRLSVSVNDVLFDDLNSFKDKLNVSKICQKALRQAIDIEKIKQETKVDDIDKQVERIKKKREEYGAIYKNEGFKDGVKDGSHMNLDEIIHFEIYNDLDRNQLLSDLASSETVRKYEALSNREFEIIDSTKHSKDEIETIYSRGKVTFDLKGSNRSTSFGFNIDEFHTFDDLYLDGWCNGIIHIISLLNKKGAL